MSKKNISSLGGRSLARVYTLSGLPSWEFANDDIVVETFGGGK